MNRNIKNIAAVVFFALLGTSAIAQVSQQKIGQNPLTINPNAALEIESSNKGLLLPRLELQATNLAAPLAAHVEGITVYNTGSSGDAPNNVTPGYYYNDGTKWVRIADATDIKTEPWFVQGGTTQATLNTQNIYQMGSVAVGKDEAATDVALDIEGAVRAGVEHMGAIGENSVAFGNTNTATGESSYAFGRNNTVEGVSAGALGFKNSTEQDYSIVTGSTNMITNSDNWGSAVFGQNNTVSSMIAQAFGNTNTVEGDISTAFGQENSTAGYGSVVFGWKNIASSPFEVVFGKFNAVTTSSIPSNSFNGIEVMPAGPEDPVMQVGNGGSGASRRNAMTILTNGNVGIGIEGTEVAAKPTQRLDIGSGSVKIRDINTNVGASNDRIVVADADGILKTLKASMPKFFYMPSIIVPTSEEQMIAPNSGAVVGDTFDDSTRQGTINLYGRYQAQFGSPMRSNAGATTNLPVLPAGELDYHITWYDNELFTSVNVSDAGVLTYTVSPTADITIGSFMNIVFAVREN